MNRREFIAAAMATVTATAMAAPLAVASNTEPSPAVQPASMPAPAPKPGRAKGQERVIDFEAHYLDQTMLDWMQGRQSPPVYDPKTGVLNLWGDVPTDPSMMMNPSIMLDVGDRRMAAMNRAGVDVQLLSSTLPMDVFPAGEKPGRTMRAMNDRLAAIVGKHPERYRGMAALAPHDPKKAAAELKRCVKDLGFVGWQVHSHCYDKDTYADHEKYLPIWEMAAELDVPVYIHPTVPVMPALQGYGYALYGSPFGFGVETSILMARLLLSGLFEKLPTLKVIQAHMGETLPMVIERMDEQIAAKTPGYKLPKLPGEYWRANVWCSVSGGFSKHVFQLLRSQMPLDHIVFGSDYPYENYTDCTAFVNSLDLTPEERAMIYSGNAAKFFNIT